MPSRAVLIFQSVGDRTDFWERYMGKSLVEEGICDEGKSLKFLDVLPRTIRHRRDSRSRSRQRHRRRRDRRSRSRHRHDHRRDSRSRSRHRHRHRADAGHGHNTYRFVSDKWRPWHEESHSHHRSEALRRWGSCSVSGRDLTPAACSPVETPDLNRVSCEENRTPHETPAPTPHPAYGYKR